MPLIHSKRPAAFKKNVETEIHHGKEPKQAVAIAYRMAGEHKARGGEMCAHGGPVHCDMGCYSRGGDVRDRTNESGHEKGVHTKDKGPLTGLHKSYSTAGKDLRVANDYSNDRPRTYGEEQEQRKKVSEYTGKAKSAHHRVLGELKSGPGPTSGRSGFAEGGEVLDDPMEHAEPDADDELDSVMVDELLEAMEKKDKRGVKDAIEALVLNCLNKKGEY